MKRSSNKKILTTHTGSLPRPAKVIELLLAEREKPGSVTKELDAAVDAAVADVVKKQVEAGVDIVNDGEQGRTDYTVHVMDRLTGFHGESSPPLGAGGTGFPELDALLAQFSSPFQYRPACNGPIAWSDFPAAEADIARAKKAAATSGATEHFMTSPSPGQIARYLKNNYYPSDEAYMLALAEVMAKEYKAIVDAGLVLQVDCPDLAMSYSQFYLGKSYAEYRKIIEANVEALNHAVKDIPADRMRIHVCWSSTFGPHHNDIPLTEVLPVIFKAKPQAFSFPAANPRHAHEWKVFKDVKLPDDKIIIPGVLDSTSNFVEHPELVCDRIVQYAKLVGPENLMVGADCGFGTFAGRVQVDTKIVYMKLASMAEGARLAVKQL